MIKNEDLPLFTQDELQQVDSKPIERLDGWKVLIVDDEPSIHTVTKLALNGFTFADKPLNFLNAYSANEAKPLLEVGNDIAIILLDVVMETDNAGLELVDYIRNELNNHNIRIILRTGQPGQAPEYKVIKKYDINDYKEKTELTNQKLNTVIYSALRSYRDITAINRTRIGLERIIDSSTSLLQINSLRRFAEGALEQLAAMMYLDANVVLARSTSAFAAKTPDSIQLLACIEKGEPIDYDQALIKKLEGYLLDKSQPRNKMIIKAEETYFISSVGQQELILYLHGAADVLNFDNHLVEVFCRNISVAIENLRLNDELKKTQEEIVYSICEVAETRSKETGNHVRRVALYSKLLGQHYGLSPTEVEQLFLAAPLHDVGKIGIPDRILNSPNRLQGEEWEVMKTHAQIGEDVLKASNLPIMNAAAEVAGQHHEAWDGSGYPKGLSGTKIHPFARIVAVADVFDALMNSRCYKPAWDVSKVDELMKLESGKKFEPKLVDLYFEHKEEFLNIHKEYAD